MHWHAYRIDRDFSAGYSETWTVLGWYVDEAAATAAKDADQGSYVPPEGTVAAWFVCGPCDCPPAPAE